MSKKKKVQVAEIVEEDDDEEVWDAVEWEELGPMESDAVFDRDVLSELLKDAVDQAWDDGIITGDEMALLTVLKEKLNVDDETFDWIINERKPEEMEEAIEEVGEDEDIEVLEVEEEVIEGEVVEEEIEYFRTEDEIPKKRESISKPPEPPEMITFSHSVRGGSRPLDRSFDLSKKEKEKETSTSRCPHCRSLIRVNAKEKKTACPICGRKLTKETEVSEGMRKLLDLAKRSYKEKDLKTASELYQAVLEQSPDNKEALFYIRKLRSKRSEKGPMMADARNVAYLSTESKRMDQLLDGGIEMGDTVLVEGPPFCGKEMLLEQVMTSTLKKGVPVIYVSTNRAMKEVLRGIIRRLPNFKEYNHKGLVRMYDLFSKHKDNKVLKEGHRIFNIDDKEDFQRFQNDLVFAQEELVNLYHGGLLVINSLSPLVSKVDMQDLQKFLQVLIARSKGYRFTNILDMASGVHDEQVVNSVEYLMDGIIEFKEVDSKTSLRMKGFSGDIMTRDWLDYTVRDDKLHLVGSFMEERIA